MKSSFYPPARWAFALLVAISIFGDIFLLFCYVPGSFWASVFLKLTGVFGLYLGIFLGKGGVKYGMFPTAVLRLLAFLKRNANTNPWPIRENLRTFPTFLPSFLARVRIRCFRKTTFTSSPFPCNLLMLSELWVKTLFFFVLSQLSDL